jgi:periplasmic divalent cation tolerance protein
LQSGYFIFASLSLASNLSITSTLSGVLFIMSLAPQAMLVLTSAPNEEVAEQLARLLVERRLAACVNILPAMRSIYRWEGQVEVASELAMQIKTTVAHYTELECAIKAVHPYAVPEIIAIPIVDGLKAYLNWIQQETNKDRNV